MKIIIILILAIAMCGCNDESEVVTGETGKPVSGWSLGGISEKCINGVVYYNGDRRLSPAFKPDGSLFLCETE